MAAASSIAKEAMLTMLSTDVAGSDGVREVSEHPERRSSPPVLHGLSLKKSRVSQLRTRLMLAKRGAATLPQDTARPPGDFAVPSADPSALHHATTCIKAPADHRAVTIAESSPHEESGEDVHPSADESSDEDATNFTAGRRSIAAPFSDDDENIHTVEYESGSGCSNTDYQHSVNDPTCMSSRFVPGDSEKLQDAFTVFQLYAHDEPNALDIPEATSNAGAIHSALTDEGYESLEHHLYDPFEKMVEDAGSTHRACAVVCAPMVETFIGTRWRTTSGPERYGRRNLEKDDADSSPAAACAWHSCHLTSPLSTYLASTSTEDLPLNSNTRRSRTQAAGQSSPINTCPGIAWPAVCAHPQGRQTQGL